MDPEEREYVQWDTADLAEALGIDGDYRSVALWNLFAAAVTAYFGAKGILSPSRGTLTSGVAWAAINVAWGAYQLATDGGSSLFALHVVLVAVAGVLAFVGRGAFPSEPWRPDQGSFH